MKPVAPETKTVMFVVECSLTSSRIAFQLDHRVIASPLYTHNHQCRPFQIFNKTWTNPWTVNCSLKRFGTITQRTTQRALAGNTSKLHENTKGLVFSSHGSIYSNQGLATKTISKPSNDSAERFAAAGDMIENLSGC